MRYNYHELDREDQWSIVTLLTLTKADSAHDHPQDIDITLTVEGIELDILKFVDRFKEQMDRWTREEARAIVNDIGGDLIDTIEAVHQILLDRL